MKHLTKVHYWSYFLLAARILLARMLFHYGWAKLTHNLFGVDQKTMDMPLKQIDLMRLSWYLADHEPFNSFVGLSQVGTAALLLFNRTAVIGAFISIPIWLNILMWDLTFMGGISTALPLRISFYLILTGLIIYQQEHKVMPALWSLAEVNPGITYPIWVYLTLPIAAISLEVIGAIPNALLTYMRLLGK